jgi:hypothetical protein
MAAGRSYTIRDTGVQASRLVVVPAHCFHFCRGSISTGTGKPKMRYLLKQDDLTMVRGSRVGSWTQSRRCLCQLGTGSVPVSQETVQNMHQEDGGTSGASVQLPAWGLRLNGAKMGWTRGLSEALTRNPWGDETCLLLHASEHQRPPAKSLTTGEARHDSESLGFLYDSR